MFFYAATITYRWKVAVMNRRVPGMGLALALASRLAKQNPKLAIERATADK
jgi:hypothetical protein